MNSKPLSKTKSLVNLANSILKFYGCETYHDSLKEIDDLLAQSGRKKVCLFLFDAFGEVILERYKKAAPYMYSHRYLEINSVFPPTTVAATTSVTTGKYPIETGYLGWTQYFSKPDKFIQVFGSVNWKDKTDKIDPPVTQSILKTKYITDDINKKAGKEIATMVMSFNYISKFGIGASNRKWARYVKDALKTHDYVYAYNIFPDHLMHEFGVNSPIVWSTIHQINHIVKKLTKKFPDTLFLAISDHGMLDTQDIKISSIPGFKETLSKDCIAIEGRFASFFVKDKEKFVEIFNNTPILKDNFVIQSREEVLANHLFGYSKTQNKIALDTIGDFTLLATNKYCLVDDYAGPKSLKARHAGITDDEVNIYLQAYNYK
jgi:hypothetical protein